MIFPIRCFTCNKIIGNLYKKYNSLISGDNKEVNLFLCKDTEFQNEYLFKLLTDNGVDNGKATYCVSTFFKIKASKKNQKKLRKVFNEETKLPVDLFEAFDKLESGTLVFDISIEDIFNYMGISRYCCRSIFTTHVESIDDIIEHSSYTCPKVEIVKNRTTRTILAR